MNALYDETDLWKKCVTTHKLSHTDYYEYRKLKNGKHRIRCNLLFAVSRSSVLVQINDPGHGKMDPIEQLKLMGEKLDEEYSKVTNSTEWKDAMRIPFYLLDQKINNGGGGFNCVVSKKKERHRKRNKSRDFSSDEEDDDVFYRGEVLSLHFESQTAQVLFYDYGFTETVASDRIYYMDERFLQYDKFTFELPIKLKYCDVCEVDNVSKLVLSVVQDSAVYLEVSELEDRDGLVINDVFLEIQNGNEKSLCDMLVCNGLATNSDRKIKHTNQDSGFKSLNV